jgi:hypothetical protein
MSPHLSHAQAPDNCITSIDNATALFNFDSETNWDIPEFQIEPGDKIFAFTPGGNCVGETDYVSGEGYSLSIAGNSPPAPPEALDPGDPIILKVYDASQDILSAELSLILKDCSEVSGGLSVLCRDEFIYEHNVVYIMETIEASDPIPVEFASFDVNVYEDQAILEWSTASEENNQGFHIEVLFEGEERFRNQGFVKGAGTTNKLQTYRFIVSKIPYGEHKVRLRQVDFDGVEDFSPEESFLVSLQTAFDIKAPYPNPARFTAMMTIAVQESQDVTVEIYDILGRRVSQVLDQKLEANREVSLPLDLSRLSSGQYFVRIYGHRTGFIETKRLVVVK